MDVVTLLLQRLFTSKLSLQAIQKLATAANTQHISWLTYLLNQKLVDSATLAVTLADVLRLPLVDLNTIDSTQLPLHLVEKQLLRCYQLVPLWQQGDTLVVGMVNPCDHEALSALQFHTGLSITAVVVEQAKLVNLLEQCAAMPQLSVRELQEMDVIEQTQDASHFKASAIESRLDDDPPIVRYVHQILLAAINKRASDIHFEPQAQQLQIRFRIDGLLYKVESPPGRISCRIITRLKIMAQLDIAEQRLPQDGRFQLAISTQQQTIDCRLSTCPTLYGEKVVVRILDGNKINLAIEKLGLTPEQQTVFLTALHNPHGMILVTGPTGSGKTVTLYSALHLLNTSAVNIASVEDPIEIHLPGINQVNVQPKIGLDFATALRAFLRQDPDVIMLGEMRDQETAEIGIKAAQTGHLLLSTLHTNSAAETLTRLVNMGIPGYNIATSVNLIIAQRLARLLCSHCKKPVSVPKKVLLQLGFQTADLDDIQLYIPQACEHCTQGYQGRIGLFELLPITSRMTELILQAASTPYITKQAQQEGMQTLWQSALAKAKQGEISLSEIKRIIKD